MRYGFPKLNFFSDFRAMWDKGMNGLLKFFLPITFDAQNCERVKISRKYISFATSTKAV